jgi:type II secretory pathway component PulC
MLKVEASILNNDPTYLEERSAGGFELKNVTVGTLAWELGLQSGDIPLTVNGYNVTTMEGVFDALAGLQTATFLTVAIQRHSNVVYRYYSIQ